MTVYQSDLSLVEDPDLLRIRNGSIIEHFQRFDSATQCFVPGDLAAYVYPNDTLDEIWSKYENPSDHVANEMIDGLQELANHCRNLILGYTSAPESRKFTVLSNYLDRFTKIANGDVIPTEDLFRNGAKGICTQTKMKCHLQELMKLIVELSDTLWTRRTSMTTNRIIQIALGDVVQHKKYGFRGVVVAWDPEPAYDITHWDGLQHIDNPDNFHLPCHS